MRKKYLILLLLFCTLVCFGQKKQTQTVPLLAEMQKYADTTIILMEKHLWLMGPPNYYVLSKKDTLINLYYYGDLTKGIKMPIEIQRGLKSLSIRDTAKVNINMRFSPIPIKNKDGKNFWNEIMECRPWTIKDDYDDDQRYCADKWIKLFDGSTTHIFLLTKDQKKQLTFSNPSFYEGECPGNKNRMAVLRMEKIFRQFFGF